MVTKYGAFIPIYVIFIDLVSEKCLLTNIMNEGRGLLVFLVGKPGFESAVIIETTMLNIHLILQESCGDA